MSKVLSSKLGIQELVDKREWKRALESFWNGAISEEELLQKTEAIRLDNLKKQQNIGIELIPVGDFSFMTMCWIRQLCLELFQNDLTIQVGKFH